MPPDGRSVEPPQHRPEITATGRYVHPDTGAMEFWTVDPASGEATFEGSVWLRPGMPASAADDVAREVLGWGPQRG